MSFSKNLEEVWRWKEEVARDTQDLSEEEQLAYFRRISRQFLEKSDPPLELPVYEVSSLPLPK
jgi:hypothetical protein